MAAGNLVTHKSILCGAHSSQRHAELFLLLPGCDVSGGGAGRGGGGAGPWKGQGNWKIIALVSDPGRINTIAHISWLPLGITCSSVSHWTASRILRMWGRWAVFPAFGREQSRVFWAGTTHLVQLLNTNKQLFNFGFHCAFK